MRQLLCCFSIAACFFGAGAAVAQVPANPYSYTRSSAFEYDPVTGILSSETVEPNHPALCVKTSYQYDAYGNNHMSTVANCAGASGNAVFATRASTQTFRAQTSAVAGAAGVVTPAGTFAGVSDNAVGHTESKVIDPRFGTVVSVTGPNALTTNWEIDEFGRSVRERRADGTSTFISYCYLPAKVDDASSNSPDCPTSPLGEAPADAISFVHSEPRDTAGVKSGLYNRVYADSAGRTVRTVTQAFDGPTQPGGVNRVVVQDTDYNALGIPVLTTQPYYLDTQSSTTGGKGDYGMTTTVYNVLGRPVAVYVADPLGGTSGIAFGSRGSRQAAATLLSYSGLVTTATNDKGKISIEELDINGKVTRTTDQLGAQIAYQFDAFGYLLQTKDALQNSVLVKHDIRGRKVSMTDPSIGHWTYDYNALGEMVWQQSPNQRALSQATTMRYDLLGRMTRRVEPEFTSSWYFDTQYADGSTCAKALGKLCGTSSTNGIASAIKYDVYGRAYQTATSVLNGPVFASTTTYHPVTGQPASMTYPTGLKVNYTFTPNGYLSLLTLGTAAKVNPLPAVFGGQPGLPSTLGLNAVLWKAGAYNAWGKAEQTTLGNGVVNKAVFDPSTGRIASTTAGINTSTSIVKHTYAWDSLQLLRGRTDHNGDGSTGAVTDSFVYDAVGRLSSYSVAAPAIPGLQRDVSFQYNALGNLLYKSDVGVYRYNTQGASSLSPHALQSVNGAFSASYGYDANGNLKTASAGSYRTVNYTSFNLPDSQTGLQGPAGGPQYTWQYDVNHQRFKETRVTSAGTRTTWMFHPNNAGGLSFESEDVGAVVSNRHYLSAGAETIGVLVSKGALPQASTPPAIDNIDLVKVEFWHKDHLGSLIATSNHLGAVTARYSYDPFGKRRTASGNYDADGVLVYDWVNTSGGTDRGYTGHEHLDDVGIIHMNGRLFDPRLGLFMQGDPMISRPDDLQNYNRYTYCHNNPMTCTDPSGYFSLGGWLGASMRFTANPTLKGYFDMTRAQPGQQQIDRYIMSHSWANMVGQVIVSYYGGPIGGALWSSYYTYQATGSMNSAVKVGAISYGTAYAFTAVGDAYPAGTPGNVMGHALVGCVSAYASGDDCGPGALAAAFPAAVGKVDSFGPVGNLAVQMVMGGTSSVLGGGTFVNGARTAAFGYLFNMLQHETLPGNKATGAAGEAARKLFLESMPEVTNLRHHVTIEALDAHGKKFTAVVDFVYEYKGRIHFEEIKVGLFAKLSGGQVVVYEALTRGAATFVNPEVAKTFGVAAGHMINTGGKSAAVRLIAEFAGRASRQWGAKVAIKVGVTAFIVMGSMPLMAAELFLHHNEAGAGSTMPNTHTHAIYDK